MRRKPHRHRVFGQVLQSEGFVGLDDRTQYASPRWQRADQIPGVIVDTDVDELAQRAVGRKYAQRTIFGIYQVDGGLNDLPQRVVQLQSGRHCDHRIEQRIHPVTGLGHNALHPVPHFSQQFAQPVVRQRRPDMGGPAGPVR